MKCKFQLTTRSEGEGRISSCHWLSWPSECIQTGISLNALRRERRKIIFRGPSLTHSDMDICHKLHQIIKRQTGPETVNLHPAGSCRLCPGSWALQAGSRSSHKSLRSLRALSPVHEEIESRENQLPGRGKNKLSVHPQSKLTHITHITLQSQRHKNASLRGENWLVIC